MWRYENDENDDDYIHHTHACSCFLTPAAADMDTPPYTCLLLEVIQKLQNSSSSARLTWLPSPSEAAAQKLPLLFAVHDDDDDGGGGGGGGDHDDDDDDDIDHDCIISFCTTIIKTTIIL